MESLHGAPIGTVSALADNAAFAGSLERLGARVVGSCARRDHHGWRADEVEKALQTFRDAGARFAVTTAKDAVKLPVRDWPLPLKVLEIALEVENGVALLDAVRQAMQNAASLPGAGSASGANRI